jgi:hypothetical protein
MNGPAGDRPQSNAAPHGPGLSPGPCRRQPGRNTTPPSGRLLTTLRSLTAASPASAAAIKRRGFIGPWRLVPVLRTVQFALPIMDGDERFSPVAEAACEALQFKVSHFGAVHRLHHLSPIRQPRTRCGGPRRLSGCRRLAWRWGGSLGRRDGAWCTLRRILVPASGEDNGGSQRRKRPVPDHAGPSFGLAEVARPAASEMGCPCFGECTVHVEHDAALLRDPP